MPTVTRSIFVARAPEQVFDFVADYRNALRFMHGVESFQPIGATTAGLGARVRTRARVLGVPVHTTMEITAYDRPRRLASEASHGVEASAVWEFVPEGAGTNVVFSSTYTLPALARGLLKDAAARAVAASTEQTLRNLKRVLEGA